MSFFLNLMKKQLIHSKKSIDFKIITRIRLEFIYLRWKIIEW